jgi:uncharacterized OB-fold protein
MSLLKPQPIGVPAPTPSLPSQPYWDACSEGKLMFQRCQVCRTINIMPAFFCSQCYSKNMGWEQSRGLGKLYSWTIVWRPQQPGFVVPYAPAIVTLNEGPRILSSIIHCEPQELNADMPLEVEFHPVSEQITLPYFRPVAR